MKVYIVLLDAPIMCTDPYEHLIEGVHSTRALAEKAKKKLREVGWQEDWVFIEEWEVDANG